jgi:hypothetical protein
MSDVDRNHISHAWRLGVMEIRSSGGPGCGVRRVDFWRRRVVLGGLVKRRSGV